MRSHELVLDWVERRLAARDLVLGGRLPGERALAEELGVSRTAVREGLRVLEAMGVVRSAVGSGPTSGTVVVAEPSVALGSALRLHLATEHLHATDVVQTRVLLETWAAEHADPHDASLDAAAALLGEMDDETLAPAEFLDRDAAFHVAVAASAGNPLIGAMMASIRHAVRDYTLAAAERLPDWNATAARLRREHRGILEALRAGDGPGASAALRAHIEGYYGEAR
ncbi:GntR family transcriptional repressor for pyruvate dehydrogenase complex [Diaminobutyricimonas aerilata]|uniref:GntR family transcriptional repressor for pyruvate dehydrogenase complex n=1 Tax=Diaminobutyricimonas aerilata TaxID=1162967 RepID=A0A2M9CFB9_9MICO|nr:FCD domain-containing protein [Diaminobutyricimonas aerilata]PJJ70621.1 GntR family transcriptional repressor for pyruvate dehydrogenase complex [Diaminobutyricimonas aerilata]